MELAVFSCGGSPIFEALLTKTAPWKRSTLPLLAFALRDDTHGVTLIDAPFGSQGLAVLPAAQRFAFGTLAGLTVRPEDGVAANLDKIGWAKPSLGLFTHLHFDHVAGLDDFPDLSWKASATDWSSSSNSCQYRC